MRYSSKPPEADPAAGPLDAPQPIAVGDWDLLFDAVRERLLRLARTPALPAPCPSDPLAESAQLRQGVHECVEALAQLHGSMRQAWLRCAQQDQVSKDQQRALHHARAQLDATQAAALQAGHLARHDGLTGLPNQRYFHERLDQLLSGGVPVALLYLDLDGFKRINDDLGHASGDEVLRVIGARLHAALRTQDMVGRLGGDEFACLLAHAPAQHPLQALASKLVEVVSAPLAIGSHLLRVEASIGLSQSPQHGNTADALLRHADAAMYRNKRRRQAQNLPGTGALPADAPLHHPHVPGLAAEPTAGQVNTAGAARWQHGQSARQTPR